MAVNVRSQACNSALSKKHYKNREQMKNRIIKLCLLLTVMVFTANFADAQAKKPNRPAKKRAGAVKKSTVKSKNKPVAAVAPPPVDTVKPAPPEAKLDIPPIKKSLRNDNAIERNLVKD